MTDVRGPSPHPWATDLPIVGRRAILRVLTEQLTRARTGHGHCILLTGESGVGKSRILRALAQEATARGIDVAAGSAFAMESGVPYGAVADALARPLRALDPAVVTLLARGTEYDLRAVVPSLPGTTAPAPADGDGELTSKARLLWNVTQFLSRLAARRPLLLMVDNAQDCDASSLELLHFLARQIGDTHIMIVLAFLDDADDNTALHSMVRSLRTTRDTTLHRLGPLTRDDLTELLERTFDLDADDAATHAAALWSHTRGNPFFVEESLKALVAAQQIRRSNDRWIIDDAAPATLPATVRDAVMARLDVLEPGPRRIAEIVSVVESRVSLALLGAVTGLDAGPLADAIDALCARRIFVEARDGANAEYEFAHPTIRATVGSTLTAARERVLHSSVAAAIEAIHGVDAIEYAGEMARHLLRGDGQRDDARTLRYLTAAGTDALARRADAEARRWLQEAVAIAEAQPDSAQLLPLLEALGTAALRCADTTAAERAWRRALDLAEVTGARHAQLRLMLLLAQQSARAGNAQTGLRLLAETEALAATLGRADVGIRAKLARAKMQQALGRSSDALTTAQHALADATALDDAALLARTHQTLLQLYAWTGPAGAARDHGANAIALAQRCGDQGVEWAAHWAMAMLEGLTGDEAGVARHLRSATALAESLASPMLQAMTAEIEIEHASGIGRWSEALALADRTIPFARAVMPHSLLPRLLVWTGLIVLARDETEKARALFDEAWALSGAERTRATEAVDGTPFDNVHNVILAHTGMGAYFLAHGDWARALDYGERGLALADRFGYVAWAIHRLIPMMLEAALRTTDYARVDVLTERLRRQSTGLGHRLGLAWATAAEALLARMRSQSPDAAARLLAAADELDAVPFVFHAAKMRRNAAQVLEADGDTAGAVRELRRAHAVFASLGAEFELRGLRTQLRSLGARPPKRAPSADEGVLSARELEIAQAVARRLSNKEIGVALGISARTVSTHLSNIFEKLGVDSRGALADAMRAMPTSTAR